MTLSVDSAPLTAPQTDVCGAIVTSTTWTAAASPYLVTCDVTVNAGVTLTLEPGTRVRFREPNYSQGIGLVVNGTLRAQGTADAPIVFTSNRSSPQKGDWKGISFGASSTNSLLDHVVVEYAGAFDSYQGQTSGVTLNTSSVTVTNSAIRHNQYTGLNVASGSPTLTDNDITDNATGIRVTTGTPNIRRNDLHGNRDYALKNEASTCLDAQDNWWGSDFGPNDPSATTDACGQGARTGPGDKVSDNVNYTPWRTHGVLQMLYLPIVARCWTLEPPQPPRTPDINAIDNGDGDGRYTVTWTATGGCGGTEYTLEEDDNPSFASPTTVYTGPLTSKEISGKNVGTYYYRVRARNPQGTSEWSASRSVVVTVPPPPCAVSCYADSSGAGFGVSCESGQITQSSSCYQAWDDTHGWVTHCSGTRTYTSTGNTYSFVLETWRFVSNGVVKSAVSVDVRGGVFGDNVQHCQNY